MASVAFPLWPGWGCPPLGARVASPCSAGPFIHPQLDTVSTEAAGPQEMGGPSMAGTLDSRFHGPDSAGKREGCRAAGRGHQPHLGVDSGPSQGTRGRDVPSQTRDQAAPGEPQVLCLGDCSVAGPGGTTAVCASPQRGRGSSVAPEGAVPGPLLPAVALGKPSKGLTRPFSDVQRMSQLIGLKEKGLPHYRSASCNLATQTWCVPEPRL